MDKSNPVELIQHRQEQQRIREADARNRFEHHRDEVVINVLNNAIDSFSTFIQAEGYPLADTMQIGDDMYIAYPLYTWRSNADREVFFDNTPISLLVDKDQKISFVMHDYQFAVDMDVFARSNNTIPFEIPQTVDDYRKSQEGLSTYSIHSQRRFDYGDMLTWSAYMIRIEEKVRHEGANMATRYDGHSDHLARRTTTERLANTLFQHPLGWGSMQPGQKQEWM